MIWVISFLEEDFLRFTLYIPTLPEDDSTQVSAFLAYYFCEEDLINRFLCKHLTPPPLHISFSYPGRLV